MKNLLRRCEAALYRWLDARHQQREAAQLAGAPEDLFIRQPGFTFQPIPHAGVDQFARARNIPSGNVAIAPSASDLAGMPVDNPQLPAKLDLQEGPLVIALRCFIAARCVVTPNATCWDSELRAAAEAWAQEQLATPYSSNPDPKLEALAHVGIHAFREALEALGYAEAGYSYPDPVWCGLALRSTAQEAHSDDAVHVASGEAR